MSDVELEYTEVAKVIQEHCVIIQDLLKEYHPTVRVVIEKKLIDIRNP